MFSLPLPRCFVFNDTATPEIYTLSLHDALPILAGRRARRACRRSSAPCRRCPSRGRPASPSPVASAATRCSASPPARSEEHTSELQSRQYLVCRLLLEKRKRTKLCHANISSVIF